MNEIFAPRVAVRVYGLAAIAFGLIGLSWGDFAAVWQPVPPTLPGRAALAYMVAIVFLVAGSSMQPRRSASIGALTLTVLYTIGVILLHVPAAIGHPSVFVMWSGMAEQLALVGGGMVAYAMCRTAVRIATGTARVEFCGRLIFGVCLIVFALAHLVYLKPTADFVPAWLPPSQMFWAYATAAGHFLAGLAILSGRAARRQTAHGHVRGFRRPGARAVAVQRSAQPLQLGRERDEFRLDLLGMGHCGVHEYGRES